MNEHLKSFRSGFGPGFTAITVCSAPDNISGLGLGVLRMKAGERKQIRVSRETAWLLMAGESAGTVDGEAFSVSRASLFDESCSCLHASAGSAVT